MLSMRVKKVADSPGLLYRVIEMVMSRLVEVMVTMFPARQNLYMLSRGVGRMVTMVQDWVVAMMKVELLARVVARVVTRAQDCVAAMMNTVQCIVSAR